MTWFMNNIGTIVISAILIATVVLIVLHLKKNKAAGKSSCGCGCSNCAMHGKCHGGKL